MDRKEQRTPLEVLEDKLVKEQQDSGRDCMDIGPWCRGCSWRVEQDCWNRNIEYSYTQEEGKWIENLDCKVGRRH